LTWEVGEEAPSALAWKMRVKCEVGLVLKGSSMPPPSEGEGDSPRTDSSPSPREIGVCRPFGRMKASLDAGSASAYFGRYGDPSGDAVGVNERAEGERSPDVKRTI
jgi:hypothetical protein